MAHAIEFEHWSADDKWYLNCYWDGELQANSPHEFDNWADLLLTVSSLENIVRKLGGQKQET
jgi:hypothetical protein